MTQFIVGLDVGQAQDFTAMAVLQRDVRASSDEPDSDGRTRWDDHYTVRALERPPLKTPYPDIVKRVVETLHHPRIDGQAELVVDATGVGRPVVDMLRAAGCSPFPVTITGGQSVTMAEGYWGVPKRILVASLAIALQTNRVHVVKKLALADLLTREMLNFKVKINRHANDSYGEWRDGEHDDLVLSVALAVWWGERSAEGGFRHTALDEAKERRRLAFADKTELPWWKARAPAHRR